MRGFVFSRANGSIVSPVEVTAVLGILAIIFLLVFGVVRTCQAQEKCTSNGGRVENYNCRTICTVDVNGFTHCNESCDWRCVGASAEGAR